jgi:hypothetical protein
MRLALPLLAFALLGSAETRLGKPLTLKAPVTVDRINAHPDQYVNKTVQIKGKVTEVCQMMGCWMALVDPASGQTLRVKVNDGEITFPKEAIGKMALAEGKLLKIELTKAQAVARAKHEAEEQGRAFDPRTISSGTTIYQIQGTGAVLLD